MTDHTFSVNDGARAQKLTEIREGGSRMPPSLTGKVALVAGATRGAGRGIALELGIAGAVVYCTGRSSRGVSREAPSERRSPFALAHRPETIEETAEQIQAEGGVGIPIRVDHTHPEEVEALMRRIARDHGRLDVLVNDIWGGDELTQWGKPFWEMELRQAALLLERAVQTHLVTSRYAVPLMLESGTGLVVEITDGAGGYYRGNLVYDLAKSSVIRLAFGMAEELRERSLTVVALTPGFLRSEAMLDHLGVSEANWRDATSEDPHFAHSETPRYVGRAVVALASDPDVGRKSGRGFSSWELQHEYGFTDVDGARPDWGAHAEGQSFGAEQLESERRFASMFRR
jgi:NAD(P)-dependent dehydrogenase (short-subunit alcohol dehydrogenase family)